MLWIEESHIFLLQTAHSEMARSIGPPLCYTCNIPPSPEPSFTDSCIPWKPMINAVSCRSRTAVPGTKISEASKVNLPSSPSLFEDWSFSVTSKTVSDILKTFKITLMTPNNHAFIVFILAILWLFHHARIDNPVSRYSIRV